jgi:hypothetical protein
LALASNGRLAEATAYYQAGLGLAAGRVPEDIRAEYYSVLARQLEAGAPTPQTRLAAAKLLLLAGSPEARERLEALSQDSALPAAGRCEAQAGLDWLMAAEPVGPPAWPVTFMPAGQCPGAVDYVAALAEGWQPGWTLNTGDVKTANDAGAVLIGWDLDQHVLEAGVEVLGRLYWRGADGSIQAGPLREPNLWPNSGNSWLALEGFWECLPGYEEPDWIPPCASQAAAGVRADGTANVYGRIVVPDDPGPDTLLTSASVPLPAGRPIVTGGAWRASGWFPRGHMSRLYMSGEPARYYDVLLGLDDLPPEEWVRRAIVGAALPADYDFQGWIRPRNEVGAGVLEFDDVFNFALPAFQTGLSGSTY